MLELTPEPKTDEIGYIIEGELALNAGKWKFKLTLWVLARFVSFILDSTTIKDRPQRQFKSMPKFSYPLYLFFIML